MTERSLSDVLQDILDAIADIEMFTAEVDFEAFEQGGKKVNMFLLCNPHNPVGKIYSSA